MYHIYTENTHTFIVVPSTTEGVGGWSSCHAFKSFLGHQESRARDIDATGHLFRNLSAGTSNLWVSVGLRRLALFSVVSLVHHVVDVFVVKFGDVLRANEPISEVSPLDKRGVGAQK
jgi:hypothetical protein